MRKRGMIQYTFPKVENGSGRYTLEGKTVSAYRYGGLVVTPAGWWIESGNPANHKSPPCWVVTHIQSGLMICGGEGMPLRRAQYVASAISRVGIDWSLDSSAVVAQFHLLPKELKEFVSQQLQ